MNQYVNDLFGAFEQVEERYYFTEVYREMNDYYPNKEAVIQSTENSLSAEIFSNWRDIMKKEPDRYDKLALDFDVRKDWFDPNIFEKELRSYRPDLVLHLSQVNWEPVFQKVYVEVKTSIEPYIQNDVRKIINAQARLQFESCVFISLNSDYNWLTKLLKGIMINETRRLEEFRIRIDWSKIYLFHSTIVDGKKQTLQPIAFSNL